MTVEGIDISNAQRIKGVDGWTKPSIIYDWQKVKDQNIRFVLAKSFEGRSYLDPAFMAHLKAAQQIGIPYLGTYFYFWSSVALVEQDVANWRHIIELSPARFVSLDLEIPSPGMADVEIQAWKNPSLTRSRAELAVSLIMRVFARAPLLYTNQSTWNFLGLAGSPLAALPRAIAAYPGPPTIAPQFHQYTGTGRLDGITGNIDRDHWLGDDDGLAQWVRRHDFRRVGTEASDDDD